MTDKDRANAANFAMWKARHHSVLIVLAKNECPLKNDEGDLVVAQGWTLAEAIRELWADLCDRTPGGAREAYLTYSDWAVFDARRFQVDEKMGTLENLMDHYLPETKRLLRSLDRKVKAYKRAVVASYWMAVCGFGVIPLAILIALFIFKFPLDLALAFGVFAAFSVSSLVWLLLDCLGGDRASGEGND